MKNVVYCLLLLDKNPCSLYIIFLQLFNRSAISNRSRSIHKSTIDEESEDKSQFCRKPLVSTKFVEWSSKRFAKANKKEKPVADTECAIYYERDWRFTR